MLHFIPGITAIYRTSCSELPPYVRECHAAGVRPVLLLDPEPMAIGPGATASDEAEQAPEGITPKSTLTFTARTIPDLGQQHAFIIIAADGSAYLIGSFEPPYPKIKVGNDLSTPADGNAAISLKVEWAGPLLPVTLFQPSFDSL